MILIIILLSAKRSSQRLDKAGRSMMTEQAQGLGASMSHPPLPGKDLNFMPYIFPLHLLEFIHDRKCCALTSTCDWKTCFP